MISIKDIREVIGELERQREERRQAIESETHFLVKSNSQGHQEGLRIAVERLKRLVKEKGV